MPDGKCGAKTKSGALCKKLGMSNGRCRLHGGLSTGAPKNNMNAAKHGIYAKYFSEDEKAAIDSMQLGRVDDELTLCRIRLQRALEAEKQNLGTPELDEVIDRMGSDKFAAPHEEKRKVRDYNTAIDKIVGRIESLEKTRAALIAASKGDADVPDDITRDDTTIAPDEEIPTTPIL